MKGDLLTCSASKRGKVWSGLVVLRARIGDGGVGGCPRPGAGGAESARAGQEAHRRRAAAGGSGATLQISHADPCIDTPSSRVRCDHVILHFQ
jgi:hypothetical protein